MAQKFRNQYDNEMKDDNTGDFYDSPVACGGFLTLHAIKRAKKRNVSKKDMILGRPAANNIERDGVIITVLGNNNIHKNNLKPGQRTLICKNCKVNHISKYKGDNPLCKECKPKILIKRICTTCDIKYDTKFKGENPKCYSCLQEEKVKKLDLNNNNINKNKGNDCKHEWERRPVGENGKYKDFKCVKCHKIQTTRAYDTPNPIDKKKRQGKKGKNKKKK